MAKNAVQTVRAALCLVLALAVANCALAGRVLDEQAAAPLPARRIPQQTQWFRQRPAQPQPPALREQRVLVPPRRATQEPPARAWATTR